MSVTSQRTRVWGKLWEMCGPSLKHHHLNFEVLCSHSFSVMFWKSDTLCVANKDLSS